MRLGLVYSTLALIILVAALIAIKPMLKTPTEANLVNPTTAQQVISINDIKETLMLINSTLGNLTKAKLASIIGFINASRTAYSNGQAPPLNTNELSTLINLASSSHLAIPYNVPLINTSMMGELILNSTGVQSLVGHDAGLLLAAQYMTTALGNSTLSQLISKLASSSSAMNTTLTINLTSGSATVGSTIMAYGRLTLPNGTGLGGQLILVTVNGRVIASAVTNSTGFYTVNITLPYIYVNETSVKALFIPVNKGLAGSTAEATVRLLFNETRLVIHVNGTVVKWGDYLLIWGNVTGGDRSITVMVGGLSLNATSINGRFNLTIPTSVLRPSNITLLIYVKPNLTYSPAERALNITVVGVRPSIRLSGTVLLAGLTSTIRISIKPLVKGNLTLLVNLGPLKRTVVVNSPNVTIPIRLPLTLGMGFTTLNVTITPNPPIEGAAATVRVFVVNLAQLAILAALAPVSLVAVRLTRGVRHKAPVTQTPVAVTVEAVVKSLRQPIPSARLSDPRVKAILDSLAKAITAVSMATGIAFGGGLTLREYLALVSGRLTDGEVVKGLNGLITLAEEALYSPRLPTDSDVEAASSYLAMVIRR
ncbi:MAG: hypothetical protein RQ838_00035 [Caldivirga sp.]|nr:hypothetical protein [Caldivirga sp.]